MTMELRMHALIPGERERTGSFKAVLYWLIANCLAGVLLVFRPQIENTLWFWFFCIPAVMFLLVAYRWIQTIR